MIYYQISLIVGCGFLFSTCVLVWEELHKCSDWGKRGLFCIALVLAFRLAWMGIFCGLEYEDSYVFHCSARLLANGIYPGSFRVEGIAVGSINAPAEQCVYGGHFILYPSVLSVFYKIFGSHLWVCHFANIVFSFMSLLILSTVSENNRSWWIAPSLYCSIPIVNVFSTSALSEGFSSFVALAFVYSLIKRSSRCHGAWSLHAIVSYTCAIMTKRDNLVVTAVPFLMLAYECYKFRFRIDKRALLFPLCFVGIALLYLLLVKNVFAIELEESVDIGRPTFSLQYTKVLLPMFLQTVFSFSDFYLIAFAVVALGVAGRCYLSNHGILVVCILTFLLCLLMYSSHYRGYWFVKSGEISHFETYRYLNNFAYLLVLPFAWLQCPRVKRLCVIVSLFLSFPFLASASTREFWRRQEDRLRTSRAVKIESYIESNSGLGNAVLVTNVPLLHQMGRKDISICTMTAMPRYIESNDQVDWYLVYDNFEEVCARHNVVVSTNGFERVLSSELGPDIQLYRKRCLEKDQ